MIQQRLLPQPTWESAEFWAGGASEELRIYYCRDCQRLFHPPAAACWRCRGANVGPEPASGRAKVAAFTVNMHQWLPGFLPPYVIAIVELDDEPDVRLTTNIVDCDPDEVFIGMTVRVCFEDHGEVSIPLFQPVTHDP